MYLVTKTFLAKIDDGAGDGWRRMEKKDFLMELEGEAFHPGMDIVLQMDEPWDLDLGGRGGRRNAIGASKSFLIRNVQDHVETADITPLTGG